MQRYRPVEMAFSDLWPLHVRPMPDELLSSWIVRLAHAHHYKVEKTCYKLFGRGHGLWSADIDRAANANVIATLSRVTATPLNTANATTLQDHCAQGRLPGPIDGGGNAPWIVALRGYHRHRRAPGLMFCPSCLREGEACFCRRWRLAFNTVCPLHEVELLDACPDCKRSIALHRIDLGSHGMSPRSGALTHCWHCAFDLRQAPVTACATGALEVARLLSSAVDNGFVAWAGNPSLHAIPFLAGIRLLARLAVRHVVGSKAQLELLPVDQRRSAMETLAPWLRRWPESFLEHAGGAVAVTHSETVHTQSPVPFWLERDLAPHRRHQAPTRHSDEVQAMVQHLSAQRTFRPSDLRSRLGVHVAPQHLAALRRSVSPSAHESLIVHLDHAIATSFDTKTRNALLQDKTMFCLYRFTDLSLDQVCRLPLHRMPALDGLALDAVWWTIPANRVQAILVVQHHIQHLRCRWARAADHPEVFLSAYTGRPMRATALHARFMNSVERARLVAQIPSVAAYKLG